MMTEDNEGNRYLSWKVEGNARAEFPTLDEVRQRSCARASR